MKIQLLVILFIIICTISSAETFHDLRGSIDTNGNIQLYYRRENRVHDWLGFDLYTNLFKLDISSMEEVELLESHSSFLGNNMQEPSGNVFHDYIFNDESGYSTINCGVNFAYWFNTQPFIRLDSLQYLYYIYDYEPVKYIGNIKRSDIYSSIIYATYHFIDDYYIIQSLDGGINWTSIENAPNYTLRGVSPYNDQLVFCASSDGGLFRSEDGLTSNTLVNDDLYLHWSMYRLPCTASFDCLHHYTSHLQFLFDIDEQHIYAIANGFNLMRSDDNGFNWNNISSEMSPIFIDVDIVNSDVLFKSVGTDIFKSVDYGETFILFQTLPFDIRGIYQVDNTDTLYVITHHALFEVTNSSVELLIQLASSNENTIPQGNSKINNFPNPFNPSTTIEFSIQNDSKVELSIYNIKGQKVKQLLSSQLSAGQHSVVWNGDDELEKPISSGVYMYKLKVNGKTEAMKKCLLLK